MFTEEEKSAPLSFISNMVRSWLPSYANWATLRKKSASLETLMEAGGGAKESIRHKHRYSDEQNRLPVNIILTTAAAAFTSRATGYPCTDVLARWVNELYPDRRRIFTSKANRLCPLNQKSNVRLSWHSVHDKYQPVKSPGVLVSVVRYCINGKMKLSATVLTRLCVNITNLPRRQNAMRCGRSRRTESGNTPPADGAGYSGKGGGNHKKDPAVSVT